MGTYTVGGLVTGVYASLNSAGFYVQNHAATADGDPATSDALFAVQTAPRWPWATGYASRARCRN